jgi:ElaB/YqjD/DUF883 family membrane-anchored ribosome-binding protein
MKTANRSPAEIESDIEQTRERMSAEIGAIGEKLSPEHIKERAKEAVVEKVHNVTSRVGRKTRETGSGLVEMVKGNPLAATMVGAGITWLIAGRNRRHSEWENGHTSEFTGYSEPGDWQSRDLSEENGESRAREVIGSARHKAGEVAEKAKDTAQEMAGKAKGAAQHLTQEAGQRARQAQYRARGFFDESPIIAAAGVLVLGAIVGAALPHTRKEDEILGPARDNLMRAAGDVAERAKDTIGDKLNESSSGGTRAQGTPGTQGSQGLQGSRGSQGSQGSQGSPGSGQRSQGLQGGQSSRPAPGSNPGSTPGTSMGSDLE